jgi:O-antigen ligase
VVFPEDRNHATLQRIAFLLAAGLAAGRAITLTFVRDVTPVLPLVPGEFPPARYAGPAVSLTLDVLCLVPLVLALLARTLRPDEATRTPSSLVALVAFAIWATLSCLWAGDPWAALVEGSGWIAAAALAWTLAITCRSWADVRLCFGLAAGVLAANVLAGLYYVGMELPDTLRLIEDGGDDLLRDRGFEPGSFAATQFLGRVTRGEFSGFTGSVNSYAAALGSMLLVTLGLAWSSLRKDCPPWSHGGIVAGLVALGSLATAVGGTSSSWPWLIGGLVLVAVAVTAAMLRDPTKLATILLLLVPPATWLLVRTAGRAAMAAIVLAGLALVVLWPLRARLRRPQTLAVVAVLCVLLGTGALFLLGATTGQMPHVSLQFRLYYWLGAIGVWLDQPILGVGFASFGDAYLLHRLPQAAEEVKDAHNLLLRPLSELGLVGFGLMVAWIVLTARDVLQSPVAEGTPASGGARGAVMPAVLAAVVPVVATVDFAADVGYVVLELMQAAVTGLVMVATVLLATAKSVDLEEVDDTPGPFLLAAGLAALGALLVHSMIDIVLFSPAVLFGAVLIFGPLSRRSVARGPGVEADSDRSSRLWHGIVLAIVTTASIGFAVFAALPTILAERAASEGDRFVQQSRFEQAERSFALAADQAPVFNADYYVRRGDVLVMAGQASSADAAYAGGSTRWPDSKAILRQAALAEAAGRLDDAAEHLRTAIDLNPKELRLRLRLAELLDDGPEAYEQIRIALDLNNAFAPDEPERLDPQVADELRGRLPSPPDSSSNGVPPD